MTPLNLSNILILPNDEVNIFIDKCSVKFLYDNYLLYLISNKTVGETIRLTNNIILRLNSIGLEEDSSQIYNVEVYCMGENFGTLAINMENNTCIFSANETTQNRGLKTDWQDKILSNLPTFISLLNLTYKGIEDLTISIDTSIPLMDRIKNRMIEEFSDNVETFAEKTFFLLEADDGSENLFIPCNTWNNFCLIIRDVFSGKEKFKIFNGQETYDENDNFCHIEANMAGTEVDSYMQEYISEQIIKPSPIYLLNDEGFKQYLLEKAVDNISLDETRHLEIKPINRSLKCQHTYKETNEPPILEKKYNLDGLTIRCEYPDALLNLIKEVNVGQMLEPTFDVDILVSSKELLGTENIITAHIITTEGCFGSITFRENSNQCFLELDKEIFYNQISEDIHANRKYSMFSYLKSILDDLNLKIISITDLTVCVDFSQNGITKIWEKIRDKVGEYDDDFLLCVMSEFKNPEKQISPKTFENSIITFINKHSKRLQMRVYNSGNLCNEDLKELMEEWNGFSTINFGRVEMNFNEEEINDFMTIYGYSLEEDKPLDHLLEEENFKQNLIKYANTYIIEPKRDDFVINMIEM